jgi:hypothetical protein
MNILKGFALGSIGVALLPITLPIIAGAILLTLVLALVFTQWIFAIVVAIVIYHGIRYVGRVIKRRQLRDLSIRTESIGAALAEDRAGHKLFVEGEQLPHGWTLQYSTRPPFFSVLDPDKQVRFTTNHRATAIGWYNAQMKR